MKAEGSRRSRSAGRRKRDRGRQRESLKGREEQAGEEESEGSSSVRPFFEFLHPFSSPEGGDYNQGCLRGILMKSA